MFDNASRFFSELRHNKIALALVVVAALVLISLPILAVIYSTTEGVQDVAENTADRQPDPTTGIAILDIVENPSAYYGEDVRVQGRIDGLYNDRAFAVTNVETHEKLLVVTDDETEREQSPRQHYDDSQAVEVSGELREHSDQEIERKYGIESADLSGWPEETRPVLVADTLSATDDRELMNLE